MKHVCSSYTHQRSIINTTFTVPTWLSMPASEKRTCSYCTFRGSPLSSSAPQAWLGINGKKRKDDLHLLSTMTFTTCPFQENWGTRGVRQSDEWSLWAWRLALLWSCLQQCPESTLYHMSTVTDFL